MFSLIVIIISALLTAQSKHVNVGYEYVMFATDFCGHGNLQVADIGGGNLAGRFNVSKEELDFYRENKERLNITNSFDEGIPAPRLRKKEAICVDTQKNSCVGGGDTWYWCGYPQYQCMTKYVRQGNHNYSGMVIQNHTHDPWVFTGWVDNNSDEPQSMTYTREQSTTTSYHWSLSSTVQVGFSLNVGITVPEGMTAGGGPDFKWSTTMGFDVTHSSSKSWSISQPVVVPPKATVKVTNVIQKARYRGTFMTHIELPHYAKLFCRLPVKGHWEWFHKIGNFLADICDSFGCDIGGPFLGFQGINMETDIKQCPLHSRTC